VKLGSTPTALTMQLDSVQFWGEDPNGTWTLRVTDAASGGTGTLLSWALDVIGDRGADDTYVFTDAYATLGGDAARQVLTDADGGVDTLNLAALTGPAAVDLRPGEASSIAGRPLTLAAGTVIEQVFGGDGADTITGNAAGNRIAGGRGADLLAGGAGADVFLFQRLEDAGDRILDFDAADGLALGDLLAALGYRGGSPLAEGWLLARAEGADTVLTLDPDGPGALAALDLVTLQGFRGALTEAQLLA
jgi:Ca2+-binding RTX toxin-like protein